MYLDKRRRRNKQNANLQNLKGIIFWGPVVIFRSLLTSLNIIFIWAAWHSLCVLEEATFSQQENKLKWSSQMQVHSNRKELFTLKHEQWAKKAEAVYFFYPLPAFPPTFSLPCSCAHRFIRGLKKRCSVGFNELCCLVLKDFFVTPVVYY